MGSKASPAPWDGVPPNQQLFVLITGANSGIGLSIGERLIDEFLATRSLTAHLILLPTTRSPSKSLSTIRALRTYATKVAQSSASLKARAGPGYDWRDTVRRVHVLSLQLDLCDLRGVYAFADALVSGPVSNPEGLEDEYLRDVRVPRLDSVVYNAAYGGWSGVDWLGATKMFFTKGIYQSVTWPDFKKALPTCILNDRSTYNYPKEPLLGEVFTACLFGHYVLTRQLLPLLSRHSPAETPGRIIWSSSLEAVHAVFNPADPQCFSGRGPYESAKRLTDILSLTAGLPAAQPFSTPFLASPAAPIPPRMYLSHPGIVASTLFPLPWWLMWAYTLVLTLARFFGSPWHNTDSYSGATSAVWLTLQDQAALDASQAQRVKWGSASNRKRECAVKKTEVEGWGWEGRVEDPAKDTSATGVFRKSVGRKAGTPNVTADDIVEFEELGGKCWQAMEHLRLEWEQLLGLKKA